MNSISSRITLAIFAAATLFAGSAAAFDESRAEPQEPRRGRGLIDQMSAFQTTVPPHAFDIILARPTSTTIAISITSATDAVGYIEFAAEQHSLLRYTPRLPLKAGEPATIELTGLTPDSLHQYRWIYTDPSSADALTADPGKKDARLHESQVYRFHTPRAPGKPFTFTVQADSHLDPNVTPSVYERTLASALAEAPDFHIDLGDTFMTDKRRDFHDALPQYLAQRYYLGLISHSAPLFMVLGNHDGEYGYAGAAADQMAGWSFAQRTRFFPDPITPGTASMYSGRTELTQGKGSHYYAFEWGDALFVVLDPFWPTMEKMRGPGGRGGGGSGGSGGGGGGGGEKGGPQPSPDADTALSDQSWTLTLGRPQYDWLDRTLASSKAKYRFVFIHHLVGGRGRAARGGVESAPFFEWGGKNADGTDGFAAHRPGWPMPIHQLLAKRGVTAVFHGHDHLYVHSERDGIAYQCVPQPGNLRGGTQSAAEYGYTSGKVLGSPGYLRVTVGPEAARIAFQRPAEADVKAITADAYELPPFKAK